MSILQRWLNRERYFHIAGDPLGPVPDIGQIVAIGDGSKQKRWVVTGLKPSGMWAGLTRVYGRRVR